MKPSLRPALAFVGALLAAGHASADCTSFDGHAVAATVEPSIVELQTLARTQACTGNATGFIISTDGLVVTAKHVVPRECSDEMILGKVQGDEHVYRLNVVQRSGLDVALLQFVRPGRAFPTLTLVRPIADQKPYRGLDVVVASFYPQYPEPVSTTARIDSTVVKGDSNVWGLCAVAANAGRSGSPVLLSDASVVAVFVGRPGYEQDVARVVPIAAITDLAALTGGRAGIRFKSGPGQPVKVSGQLKPLLIEFHLEVSDTTGHRYSGLGIVELKGDKTNVDNLTSNEKIVREMSLGLITLALQSISVNTTGRIKFSDKQSQTFNAPANFVFDTSWLDLHVDTNLIASPLSIKPCSTAVVQNCYEFSADHRHLSVHYSLFSSGRMGSWLNASIVAKVLPIIP